MIHTNDPVQILLQPVLVRQRLVGGVYPQSTAAHFGEQASVKIPEKEI